MIKTITLGNKNYDMKSSAYTMFAYKDETGRDLLNDIKSINEVYEKINGLPEEKREMAWLGEFSEIVELGLKMAYIMTKENNPLIGDFKTFAKNIDSINENGMNWMQEVLQLAINPLLGRIQSSHE